MHLDDLLRLGHPFRMALGGMGAVIFLAIAYLYPEVKFFALLFVLVALVGLWRDVQKRRSDREGVGEMTE